MNMTREECDCSDNGPEMACRMCGSDTTLPYWCETCQRLVPEKRCPCCGLKAQKAASRGECDVSIKSRQKT